MTRQLELTTLDYGLSIILMAFAFFGTNKISWKKTRFKMYLSIFYLKLHVFLLIRYISYFFLRSKRKRTEKTVKIFTMRRTF